jgi:hypothetical protein
MEAQHLVLLVKKIPELECSVVQVVEQTHIGKVFGRGGVFTSRTGFVLRSHYRPEYVWHTRSMLVRGLDKTGDGLVVTVPDNRLDDLLAAVKEYNQTYAEQPKKELTEDFVRVE